jgi:hypothetical protein
MYVDRKNDRMLCDVQSACWMGLHVCVFNFEMLHCAESWGSQHADKIECFATLNPCMVAACAGCTSLRACCCDVRMSCSVCACLIHAPSCTCMHCLHFMLGVEDSCSLLVT